MTKIQFLFYKKHIKNKKISGKFYMNFKRSPLGVQKDYIWEVKGVLLEGKRGTFGGQKESFWETTVFTSENDGNFMGLGGITAQATAGAP
ncbi:MAG: hypothetical protein U0K29_02395 [Prevotella sp.]|nr:hypothetical protein [Prevotella sp.]